jgi:hypothetical protein
MDLDSAGAENVGRNEAFSQGHMGAPGRVASSLAEDSAVYNSKVPGKFTAHSVLTPLGTNPGGNGMSAQDAENRTITGSYLGSANGVSQGNYQATAMLKMMGEEF